MSPPPIQPYDPGVVGTALSCLQLSDSLTLPPTGLVLLCCPGKVQDLLSQVLQPSVLVTSGTVLPAASGVDRWVGALIFDH